MVERRVAVVAGASGGLGRAFAEMLLDRDHRVFALSRTPLPAASGLDCITTDPADPTSLAEAVAAVAASAPRIHLLMICTGILHGPDMAPEKALRQFRRQPFEQAMLLNAFVPLQVLAAFAPLLTHSERAVAAALSAKVGSITDNRLGGWYSYRMSKAALNMGLKTAAIELARPRASAHGLRGTGATGPIVVAVHPGTTITPLAAPYLARQRARPAAASAARVLDVLDGLGPEDSGKFFNWDGSQLPW